MNISMHKLGLSLGIVFGISMLIFALLSMFLGIGTELVTLLGSLYVGYSATTFVGILLGVIYGFIHGYIVGALLVLVSDRL